LVPEDLPQNATAKKNNRKYKLAIAVALLVLIPIIGTTFAANIGINTGTSGKVQFGQGATATVACASSFTITPSALFIDSTTAGATGTWNFETMTVSGIDLSSTGCYSNTLTFQAITGSSGAVQTVAANCSSSSNQAITIVVSSGTPAPASGCNYTLSSITSNSVSGGFTVSLNSASAPLATSVDKITVQSS
jgi:hypothetical protein